MLYIRNARIKPIIGKDIENGSILVENGKIKAVSEGEQSGTDGAEVIDAGGKLVTPGLVDAHTHLGLFGTGVRWEGMDVNEMTDPITPHLRAFDAINPMDQAFELARNAGITAVGTGPGSANVICGTFAAIKTYGKRIDDMVLKRDMAMKIAFGENAKQVYGESAKKAPMTRMAIAAMIRETLIKAQRYMQDLEEYEASDKPDKKRPAFDMKLEALLPVLRREIPFKAHAHRADDIFTACRIANDFNVRISLDHCSEGHLIADELEKEGKPCIVGPTFVHPGKPEVRNKSFETVKILIEKGLVVAITTDSPVIPLEGLPLCVGLAIKAGTPEAKAWECITINPAKIMGVEDRIGSLEHGQDADIVIHSGNPLLDIWSAPLYTIIDGKIVYRA